MMLKEEAKELIDKFRKYVDCDLSGENGFEYSKDAETYNAKQCALISINLIIKIETNHCHDLWVEHYKELKKEIENL